MKKEGSKYEGRVINTMEKQYMKEERRCLYTMLEDAPINWHWEERDVKEFDSSFNAGMNIFQLAEKFGRTQVEVAIMLIDRELQGKIGVVNE